MAEIKDEYIQWSGPATFPAETTFPAYDRSADGNTTVHSHKGWEWVESDNPFQKAAASLAQSTIEASIRRMRTVFGKVFYQKGNSTDKPDFPGETYGDTARIQDPSTLDIVAEWKWNGVDWERARVSGEQISNLDVGRLTAGSAAINDLAARRIAGDIGKFLQLTTDQLTVTGNAAFVDLTAKHIWTRIINARSGEFEKIKAGMLDANSVNASNIQVGALDGKVITGATVQTSRFASRGLKLTDGGMEAFSSSGERVMNIDANTGSIEINGRLGRSDTWSECFFNDVVYTETGTDVAHDGARIGVGVGFRSKIDDWSDGTITLERDSQGRGAIAVRTPYPRAWNNFTQPSLHLGHDGFSVNTGYYNNKHDSIIELKPGLFNVDISSGSIYYSIREFAVFKNNARIIYSNGESAALYNSYAQTAGIWVHKANGLGFKWAGSTKYWVDDDGFHIGGNKKFTMLVPELSRKRGGMRLEHSATESPYDGIEYWESLTLDSDGNATWVLPDYVPKIASKKAPWVVFTNTEAKAVLDTSDKSSWVVRVSGLPAEAVGVLVKGARQVDKGVNDNGEPIMRDYARESPWALPAPEVSDGDATIGGGQYGPAPQQMEDQAGGR